MSFNGPEVTNHSSSPFVVIVVLTWNDTQMTIECLESVFDSDYPNFKVVLVDNGSEEPCGEILKARFEDVELLVLPENRGFTGGSNAGLERGIELGGEYIHLIGNDSTLATNTVSELVRVLIDDKTLALASPLVWEVTPPDEAKKVAFYYADIDRARATHRHYIDASIPYDSRSWPVRVCDFVPFIAAMFRREALEDVGLFDESLSTCWEDYDLCIRFSDAGWLIATGGDSIVVHKGSMTTGRVSPYITYLTTRNRLICLFRYASLGQIVRNTPYLLRSFYWQVKKYGFKNWSCHKAFFMGVMDFIMGVRGVGRAPIDRNG